MTAIFFAFSISGETKLTFERLARDVDAPRLNMLVSFFYLRQWDERPSQLQPARTMLDSGAYSAWKSGAKIDIDRLIAETKRERWNESVTLDVIGNPEASMRNALYMRSRGSPAYPVFHYGEPWEMLTEYARAFPKIGLSCRFGETPTESMRWLGQCFARAWPFRFHSFGWVAEKMLHTFPFQTADTASWNNRPSKYGLWKAFDGAMSVRGVKDLRAEINTYLKLEAILKHRWAKELAQWEEPSPPKNSDTLARSRTTPSPSSTRSNGSRRRAQK